MSIEVISGIAIAAMVAFFAWRVVKDRMSNKPRSGSGSDGATKFK